MNKTLSLKTLALGRLGMLAIASSFCGLATAQIKDVKGTITDSSGEPLIGVSIMEKGTSNGTVSDIDGNFTISTNKSNTLVISYLGYTSQEVNATSGKPLQILLKENTELLDEVVVV